MEVSVFFEKFLPKYLVEPKLCANFALAIGKQEVRKQNEAGRCFGVKVSKKRMVR